jgi:hypothetical protein
MLKRKIAVTLALLPLAGAVQAQPMSDQQYCDRLSELYLRYVGGDESSSSAFSRRSASPEGRWAVNRCEKGDTASGIPVLEKILRDNRFTLPQRG